MNEPVIGKVQACLPPAWVSHPQALTYVCHILETEKPTELAPWDPMGSLAH